MVDVPVDVVSAGNLKRVRVSGNHCSVRKHAVEVWEKAVGDVKTGMAIAMPGRWVRRLIWW